MSSKNITSQANTEPFLSDIKMYSQVHLQRIGEKLYLILPDLEPSKKDKDWTEHLQDLKCCLKHHKGTWKSGTEVRLIAKNRLLDSRQFHSIGKILEALELHLTHIFTSRRQTAVTAATIGYSVEQEIPYKKFSSIKNTQNGALNEPLYLKTTIRSGMVIRHPGTIIIQGDVNPGGEIIADGDIIIWGCLRGIAHAGAQGDSEFCVMALKMQPTQLRIGTSVARPPSSIPEFLEPEVAYLSKEGIHLKSAINFNKTHIFANKEEKWTEKKSLAM
ncbi:septum site-determining protein MinC [Candidatus Atelocyanobacterium thalassae]|uniref:Probable septum site-determining protein MinC n=1 Tax=cyanobacterium endosymbiont of Braarudosphaera bigelowii TaxID=1285375 RepID=A0ABM7U506_9CHRO|nr:septum site-determining protein MinC [Candidatus Atelocyanobacterium thalassa]BDA39788.1 septum site-determining protein MinC [cyanobacterium endosymbiont of Braarudosphaera bigelowii]